jgi:hypothetical protein
MKLNLPTLRMDQDPYQAPSPDRADKKPGQIFHAVISMVFLLIWIGILTGGGDWFVHWFAAG